MAGTCPLLITSCSWVLDYPDSVLEQSSALCTDGTDNDFDGHIDCDDPKCDGFCPEQEPSACTDGRDNDGDGLVDGSDPRCWPSSSPSVTRCASWDPVEMEERFDGALSDGRWLRFGVLSDDAPVAELQSPANREDRPDRVLGFSNRGPAEGLLGGIASVAMFDGDWRGFELTFQARLEADGLARIGLVPASLAKADESPVMNADSAAVLVELGAPLIALQVSEQKVAADWPSPEAWHGVRLAAINGELLLEVDGAEVARAQLPAIPPSRLVVWGESKARTGLTNVVQLDDIRIRIPGIQPCGVVSPQIPLGSACRYDPEKRTDDVGFTVSTATRDDIVCAVVTTGPAGTATTVQSWTSPDGFDWSWGGQWPGAGELALLGAAVAFDPASKSFRAVVSEMTESGVRLRGTSSTDCATWTALEDLGAMPANSEAPSYLLPGIAAPHEVYFTRPPSTESSARTVWRMGSDDGTRFDTSPELVAELPDTVYADAPFAISRVGQRDVVAVYALSPNAAAPGLGVLVAMNDSLSSWQPAEQWPLLSPEAARGGFDSNELVSGSVVWSADRGVVLYAARGWPLALQNEGGGFAPLTVGIARLSSLPDDAPTDPSAFNTCGDGHCDVPESCSLCAIDCGICDGELIVADRFDSNEDWIVQTPPGMPAIQTELARSSLRTSAAHGKLLIDPSVPGWLARALPAPLVGDFELSFDIHIDPPARESDDSFSLLVGVGDGSPARAVDPGGVFVRIDSRGMCSPGAPAFSPRVNRAAHPWKPPELASTPMSDCATAVSGTVDRWHHVTLKRQGHTVSVQVRDRDGCDQTSGDLSTEYIGTLNSPSFLLVGYPGVMGRTGWNPLSSRAQSAALDNLVLRIPSCDPESTPCGANSGCVDLLTSNEHCGACFEPVLDAEACEAGERVCKGTMCADPTSGSQVCTDLATDSNHCGACGNQLTRHEVCVDGLRVAKMVQVPEGFWIDSTEVTRTQYEAWLARGPSAAGQHPACEGWHSSFKPVCSWPPGDNGNHPVIGIDWCDAYAYCEGVGKRMCGAIGGGPAPWDGNAKTGSQWYTVCSSGGIHTYTFGDEYDPNACYGALNPLITCVPSGTARFCDTGEVGGLETCQSPESGYEGVYDLIHNSWEPIDGCKASNGRMDFCPAIGSAADYGSNGKCTTVASVARDLPDAHRSIRCCAW